MLAIDAFRQDAWTRQDPRLFHDRADLTPEWHRDHAVRMDYAHRHPVVETEVLAAAALGLTPDELHAIYRVHFPVMRQHEADTYYDANDRIAVTPSKALPGVGLPRKAIKDDISYAPRTRNGTQDGIGRPRISIPSRFFWQKAAIRIARPLGSKACVYRHEH